MSTPLPQAQAGTAYDLYRVFLADGRRATVWVAPGESSEQRIAEFLSHHRIPTESVSKIVNGGFRNSEERPVSTLTRAF